MKMQTRGKGDQNSENFVDVICMYMAPELISSVLYLCRHAQQITSM